MTPEDLDKELRRLARKICGPRKYDTFASDAEAYAAGLCAGNAYARPDGTLHVVLATTTSTTTTTTAAPTTTTTTTAPSDIRLKTNIRPTGRMILIKTI